MIENSEEYCDIIEGEDKFECEKIYHIYLYKI